MLPQLDPPPQFAVAEEVIVPAKPFPEKSPVELDA